MKYLALVISIISGLLVVFGILLSPLFFYVAYTVYFGGVVEGDIIYLDIFAPSKLDALIDIAICVSLILVAFLIRYYSSRHHDSDDG